MSTHEFPTLHFSASRVYGSDWTWMLYPSSHKRHISFHVSNTFFVFFFVFFPLCSLFPGWSMEQPRRVSSGPIPFFRIGTLLPIFLFHRNPLASRGLWVGDQCAGHSRDWENTCFGSRIQEKRNGNGKSKGNPRGIMFMLEQCFECFSFSFLLSYRARRQGWGGVTEATGLSDATTTQEETVRIWDGISTKGLFFYFFLFLIWIGLDWDWEHRFKGVCLYFFLSFTVHTVLLSALLFTLIELMIPGAQWRISQADLFSVIQTFFAPI